MRSASLVQVLPLLVAACSEPAMHVEPAQVNWMEWPAEVPAATPFTVRLVGFGMSCLEVAEFETAPTVDQSAVTFEPYFLLTGRREICPLYGAPQPAVRPAGLSIVAPFFDTRAAVPGLDAQLPRTYEIRAATNASLPGARDARLPIRTFGDVTVRGTGVDTTRLNAGGAVYALRDSLGCLTLVPLVPYVLHRGYVVENPPADTAQDWTGFVRGYIYEPAAPVCGQAKVFHLVTRN